MNLPQNTLFKSFIRPHLDYSDILYDNHKMNKIEKVQYKACLAITDALLGIPKEKTYDELSRFALREAVAQRCSVISQNSRENTGVSFLIKLQASASKFIKKRFWHRCFPVNFAKFLRTPFLTEHLRWLLLHSLTNKRWCSTLVFFYKIINGLPPDCLYSIWISLLKKTIPSDQQHHRNSDHFY